MTASPFATHLAAEVRAEIARQQRKTTAVASTSGVTAKHLYRRLGGQAEFTASELFTIAEALGLPASTLVGRAEDRLATGAAS